jgi:hypothetical protein
MEILGKELPLKDLEGQTIGASKNFTLDLKKGQDVNEDYIADVRNKFRTAFFLYKRKKSRWISLYNRVTQVTVQPAEFADEYLRK